MCVELIGIIRVHGKHVAVRFETTRVAVHFTGLETDKLFNQVYFQALINTFAIKYIKWWLEIS